MIDPNAALFREVAAFIDAVDQEVEDANERKKEYWADMRQRLTPSDVKALQGAIKIRRKRRKDPEKYDAIDWRTDEILNLISDSGTEFATHARPREPVLQDHIIDPPHDPETGELTEPAGPALPRPEQQAGAESPTDASAPAVLSDEFPDLPDCLRRKKVAA